MSKYIVRKSSLQGTITAPSSKSHSLRAILFGALGKGKSVIGRYLPSSDTASMITACQLLGAKIEVTPSSIEIEGINGRIHSCEDVINAGNSGLVLRFCAAVGALSSHPVVITGDYSIRHYRPIKPLLEGLKQLSASAISMRGNDFAPVIVSGPLQGGTATIDGEDSQPVSALLIAASFAPGRTELHVKNAGEKPWVGMTLAWFQRLGIFYENRDFAHYSLRGGSRYEGFSYTVPGDFSSAAFPIAAALITRSELTIKNLDMQDPQGDRALIAIFIKMGASIDIDERSQTLYVRKGALLSGIDVDINDFIDSITILAVVACYAEGVTRITNASIARCKECDRLACIAAELRKMGADITETADGLVIKGSLLKGAQVSSYNDHRMALSLAVAGLGAKGETVISSSECVSKTFPQFVSEFSLLGAHIQESA